MVASYWIWGSLYCFEFKGINIRFAKLLNYSLWHSWRDLGYYALPPPSSLCNVVLYCIYNWILSGLANPWMKSYGQLQISAVEVFLSFFSSLWCSFQYFYGSCFIIEHFQIDMFFLSFENCHPTLVGSRWPPLFYLGLKADSQAIYLITHFILLYLFSIF